VLVSAAQFVPQVVPQPRCPVSTYRSEKNSGDISTFSTWRVPTPSLYSLSRSHSRSPSMRSTGGDAIDPAVAALASHGRRHETSLAQQPSRQALEAVGRNTAKHLKQFLLPISTISSIVPESPISRTARRAGQSSELYDGTRAGSVALAQVSQ